MSDLPATLRAFADTPAADADASALATADASDLQALLDLLATAGRRAHLELISRASSLPKPLRKTAGKAAYRLKSAGVGESALPARGVDLERRVTLDDLALVIPPGVGGTWLVMLAELPDATAVSLDFTSRTGEVRARVIEQFAAGRLRGYKRQTGYHADEVDDTVLGDAALGVRLVHHLQAELRAVSVPFPTAWSDVLWWCDKARAHGADPDTHDARARLADALAAADDARVTDSGALFTRGDTGDHWPPPEPIEALSRDVVDALDAEGDLTRDEFVERLEGLADIHCDRWYGRPATRERAARALDASADVLLARGDEDAALTCLAVADELREGAQMPHEVGLLRAGFRRSISYDSAWNERCARRLPDFGADAG